jgi:hypothetical protein
MWFAIPMTTHSKLAQFELLLTIASAAVPLA